MLLVFDGSLVEPVKCVGGFSALPGGQVPIPLKPQPFGARYIHTHWQSQWRGSRMNGAWSSLHADISFLPILWWGTVRKIQGSVACCSYLFIRARECLSTFGPNVIKEDYWPCKNPFFQERNRGGFKPYINAWYLVPNFSGFRKKNSVCCAPSQSPLQDQRTLTGLFSSACRSLWPVVRSSRGTICLKDARNKMVW